MAATFNIRAKDNFYAGTDTPIDIYMKQTDQVTPQNVSSWAMTHELKASANGTIHSTKTVGSGIVVSDGLATSDLVTVTIADTDTEGLIPSGVSQITLYHQLRRTDAGSEEILSSGFAVLKATGN